MSDMTPEQIERTIAALLEEKRGFEMHGDEAGVEGVDAELQRLGALAKPKRSSSTKRDA